MAFRRTLLPNDIVTERPLRRRSAIAVLGALGTLGAIAAIILGAPAGASAATDSDARDLPGRGRTGFTDRDAGPGADGVGRGVCAERGWSDADSGDPVGRGRGPCRGPSTPNR